MATGGNQQTASPLAEFGSFSVKDSGVNSTIHLCQCRGDDWLKLYGDDSNEAFRNKVNAIGAAAVVWPKGRYTPSGLWRAEVLCVDDSWDGRVGGLQQAESRGHRSVAVEVPWWVGDSIQLLFDYVSSRRAAAATDIWVVYYETGWLSDWQLELSDDARYQSLPVAATASPLAEFGSFSVKDSAVDSIIHLCQCPGDGSNEAYENKVRAIRAAALVWERGWDPPSGLPGVELLRVGDGWDARVGGLQQAESRGHRSVAVAWGWGDIKLLLDHAASRRATAATDIWVLDWSTVSWLSAWQRELSDDARYQRLK